MGDEVGKEGPQCCERTKGQEGKKEAFLSWDQGR